MIELVLIGLLQAVAGEPAGAAEQQAPAAQEQTAVSEAPAVQSPEADQPAAAPIAAAEPQMRRERVCHEVEVTGRRMPQRVCRNIMVPVEPSPQPAPTQ